MESIGLQARQGVRGSPRDGGQGAIVESRADSLSQVSGEKALIMGNFLEMLPLAELPDGVKAALTVELMVERFIKCRTDSGRDICFNMGQ